MMRNNDKRVLSDVIESIGLDLQQLVNGTMTAEEAQRLIRARLDILDRRFVREAVLVEKDRAEYAALTKKHGNEEVR